jgi:hypothetical protein
MANTEEGTRVAGVWLAIASILLAGALVGHGPIHPDMSRQMGVITDGLSDGRSSIGFPR